MSLPLRLIPIWWVDGLSLTQNIDAGTMSPFEHGEVYVLEDGGEADLDLGNYERFLDICLTMDHNITTGKIYRKVMDCERRGDYLGKTVQVIPHISDAVIEWIREVSVRPVNGVRPEICLIEVGGTVGDIESAVYLEALQQLQARLPKEDFVLAHVAYVPIVGEQKTKPTQMSVKQLRAAGLRPDIILCRCTEEVNPSARAKISTFCQVRPENVVSIHNVSNIYRVPLMMLSQGLDRTLMNLLHLTPKTDGLSRPSVVSASSWELLADRMDLADEDVKIGIVGKYTGSLDTYLSVVKALIHSCVEVCRRLDITWIESEQLEEEYKEKDPEKFAAAWSVLGEQDGILIPGGFGDRGVMGKAAAAGFCRRSKKPFLGVCLGMQVAVIDFAQNVLGWKDANSEEFNPNCERKVVVYMPETREEVNMGGTMRLGLRTTLIQEGDCMARRLYGGSEAVERHRHRYEVNPDIIDELAKHGMIFTGKDDTGRRMEILEIPDHPFFVAAQSHPEFTSRPTRPNPCFLGFVLASCGELAKRFKKYDNQLRPGAGLVDLCQNEENAISSAHLV